MNKDESIGYLYECVGMYQIYSIADCIKSIDDCIKCRVDDKWTTVLKVLADSIVLKIAYVIIINE